MIAVLAISLAVGGAVLLRGFFMVVRSRWPDNYFSLTSQIEYRTSRGRVAYAVFRFAPVIAVFALVSVTARRAGAGVPLTLAALTVLHLADTTGRLLIGEFRAKLANRPVNGSRALLALAITVPIVAIAAMVGLFSRNLSPLIPGADKFVESLWTAAVTAVATALVLQSTKKSADLPDIVRLETASLDTRGLMAEVDRAAAQWRTSPAFLTAIMITENLQRPRWFRAAERLVARFSNSGTYGVMQVRSSSPISDAESVRRTAELFAGYIPDYGTSGPIEPYLRAAFYKHNPSDAFIDMAMEIYGEVAPPPVSASTSRALDGRPVVEVLAVEQRGDLWELHGTASVAEATLAYQYTDPAQPTNGHVSVSAAGPNRGRWKLTVPLKVRGLIVGEPQEADHVPHDPDRWAEITTHYVY